MLIDYVNEIKKKKLALYNVEYKLIQILLPESYSKRFFF